MNNENQNKRDPKLWDTEIFKQGNRWFREDDLIYARVKGFEKLPCEKQKRGPGRQYLRMQVEVSPTWTMNYASKLKYDWCPDYNEHWTEIPNIQKKLGWNEKTQQFETPEVIARIGFFYGDDHRRHVTITKLYETMEDAERGYSFA